MLAGRGGSLAVRSALFVVFALTRRARRLTGFDCFGEDPTAVVGRGGVKTPRETRCRQRQPRRTTWLRFILNWRGFRIPKKPPNFSRSPRPRRQASLPDRSN